VQFITKDKRLLGEEDWNIFYKFYANTYLERMQKPYLNIEFFKKIHRNRDDLNPIIFFAIQDGGVVAGSLCFEGDGILYGRHWGCSKNIQNLHFECCYYQGIEYCIENNLSLFDPGIQGEYKIRRGLSLNYLAHCILFFIKILGKQFKTSVIKRKILLIVILMHAANIHR
jgi:predicted N-acyltransferase